VRNAVFAVFSHHDAICSAAGSARKSTSLRSGPVTRFLLKGGPFSCSITRVPITPTTFTPRAASTEQQYKCVVDYDSVIVIVIIVTVEIINFDTDIKARAIPRRDRFLSSDKPDR
jgi:hypothetical protein